MRNAGVDLVQGYLLGRPVPLSQLDLTGANWPREIVAHPQPANRDDDRRIELRLARSPPLPGNRARRS